ncbi:MAG: hypothetical protein IPP29_14805 [Bacteroidetes bacterium]|nr:hypothetical protein [Bacteroidota bacterium]
MYLHYSVTSIRRYEVGTNTYRIITVMGYGVFVSLNGGNFTGLNNHFFAIDANNNSIDFKGYKNTSRFTQLMPVLVGVLLMAGYL